MEFGSEIMKSHDLKKALCQWTAMLALVVSGAVWAANGVDFSQSPEVSGTQEGAIRMPKEQDRMPLNYVNQPPMIPHSVEGYQVTTNTNRCLQCHGVESYRTTGAPRISPTHFMDSDGKCSGRGSGSASLFLSAMSRTAGRYRANRGEYLYPVKRLREIRGYYGKF
ncbi:hypothetical protein EIMP300_39040 [Escherichia coli]|uniref:Periplasmic nitrate reductase, electron transfer subunit n=1 Tax=Escherichia coli TaxID=562 RepID=A0A8S0FQC1_ECOLX|nr:hypothetical protein EIMP300_39040 [Escherichia coli]